MAAAIGVRGDYNAARLRELAKRSDDANQTRRLLALAAIYDGGSRTEAAKTGGGGRPNVRGWGRAFHTQRAPGPGYRNAPPTPPALSPAPPHAVLRAHNTHPTPAHS